MITRVSANKSSFKTVEFTKGFNVVWADRTKESTPKDSRNGLGKSTLIEIMHFCLGANAPREKGLMVNALEGWEFSLGMLIGGQHITVSRSVDNPRVVSVEGDVSSWPLSPKVKNGRNTYGIKDWNLLLGYLYFGLPVDGEERKYHPTFRSLISYFIRRHKDAFSKPFENHSKQVEWDKQVNNAFLLGLSWEDAAEMQELKDRKKDVEDFRKAVKAGVVQGFFGSLGDLEARKVRLKAHAEQETENLQSFKVHPQYEQIQVKANRLTGEIHEEINANLLDNRLITLYEKDLTEEQPPLSDNIERLYKEAGAVLPSVTLRRLEEVKTFHKNIIENRRAFLAIEIGRLKRQVAKRKESVKNRTDERSSLMTVLQTHGALEEYTLLQKQYMNTVNELNSITSMIENTKSFESRLSEIKIAQEVLQQKARRDYDERQRIRERAITLFNSYSEILYSAPGKLVLDVGPTGFKFAIEIERSGSAGISNMTVFCYDLMLSRLWADRIPSPRLLIHDSTIFDGVDERQIALALENAAGEAEKNGFQYICTLNSDHVPWKEFSKEFDLKKYIKLRLTDESVDGCLLGVRF